MSALLLILTFFLPAEAVTEEIMGGHEAQPHSRPHMTLVQFLVDNNAFRCGGSLVEEEFVLTAAHCVGSPMQVILGAHNITKQEKMQQVFRVRKTIPHSEYDPTTFHNDIMLLQLEKKAKLTEAVQLLSLPKGNSQVKPGDVCEVTGWGYLTPNGTYPETLQEVDMVVQKDEMCQQSYSRPFYPATQLCLGDPKIQKSTLKGDSGDPLICNDVFEAIGCHGKTSGKTPRILTKVPPFVQWIKDTIKHHKLQGGNEALHVTRHLS